MAELYRPRFLYQDSYFFKFAFWCKCVIDDLSDNRINVREYYDLFFIIFFTVNHSHFLLLFKVEAKADIMFLPFFWFCKIFVDFKYYLLVTMSRQ